MSLKTQQIKVWETKAKHELDKYWKDTSNNKRTEWFIEKLKEYEFESIYEVGFFSGRNLKRIQDTFPNKSIGGLDISEDILSYARRKVPLACLECSDIYNMDVDNKWDIVFTMGVLLHIPKEGISDGIKRCVSKAKKYVIHLETDGNNAILHGPKSVNPSKVKELLRWKPNISDIYKELGLKIKKVDLPRDVSMPGAAHFIIVEV